MNKQNPTPRLSDSLRTAPLRRDETEDSIDLLDLVRNVWHRKWLIIGIGALFGGIVAIVVSTVTPRYSATAKVMLNPRETRVVTSQEVVSNLDLSNPVIETEMALIRSSVLLEEVIREIGLENMPEFDPAQVSEPSGGALLLTEAVDRATSLLEGGGSGQAAMPDVNAMAQDAAIGDAEEAGLDDRYLRAVRRLREHLLVFQQGNSYVINISASAEDPKVVALTVNTIAERYISNQVEEQVEGTRRASAWLQTRVEDLREQVADAEGDLEAHRAEKVTADGGGLDTASQQLAAMTGQLAAARADHAAAQARYDQITTLVEEEGLEAATEVLSSQLVTTLRTDYSGLMRERADLSTRYGANHPQLIRLQAEIARAEGDLAEEIRKIIEGFKKEVEVASIRERSISGEVLALEKRVASITQTSTGLRDLEREASALQTVYENMLSRLKETRAHEALTRSEAKVIDYALPPGAPAYPKTKLLIAAASTAGLALGLGLVLLLELNSNTFRSPHQVARRTRVPVLSVLPRWRRMRKPTDVFKALADNANNDYGEHIRQLRSSLMFGGGQPPSSIAVTSSVAGEGKTSTTLALAYMNALTHKKVIVVDCDFRRAALCGSFGWSVAKDFGAVLRGDATLPEAIVSDKDIGFDVLPVAQPVANVSDVLSPARFREIIDALSERYDLVLIDSPPVLQAADASVFVPSADALVYLVQWNSTDTNVVSDGLIVLSELGLEPLGTVLTQVDQKRIRDFGTGSVAMAASEGRA